jgi:hypothetical protein
MKLDVNFVGRRSGALGVTYEIRETLEVPDNITFEEFRMKLYEVGYECINLDVRDVYVSGTNDRHFYDRARA